MTSTVLSVFVPHHSLNSDMEQGAHHVQVLLLMATALNVHIHEPTSNGVGDTLGAELRTRQQCIAEITEMIHVNYHFILLYFP